MKRSKFFCEPRLTMSGLRSHALRYFAKSVLVMRRAGGAAASAHARTPAAAGQHAAQSGLGLGQAAGARCADGLRPVRRESGRQVIWSLVARSAGAPSLCSRKHPTHSPLHEPQAPARALLPGLRSRGADVEASREHGQEVASSGSCLQRSDRSVDVSTMLRKSRT